MNCPAGARCDRGDVPAVKREQMGDRIVLKSTLAIAAALCLGAGTALSQGIAPEPRTPNAATKVEPGASDVTSHGAQLAVGARNHPDEEGATHADRRVPKLDFPLEPESVARGTEP